MDLNNDDEERNNNNNRLVSSSSCVRRCLASYREEDIEGRLGASTVITSSRLSSSVDHNDVGDDGKMMLRFGLRRKDLNEDNDEEYSTTTATKLPKKRKFKKRRLATENSHDKLMQQMSSQLSSDEHRQRRSLNTSFNRRISSSSSMAFKNLSSLNGIIRRRNKLLSYITLLIFSTLCLLLSSQNQSDHLKPNSIFVEASAQQQQQQQQQLQQLQQLIQQSQFQNQPAAASSYIDGQPAGEGELLALPSDSTNNQWFLAPNEQVGGWMPAEVARVSAVDTAAAAGAGETDKQAQFMPTATDYFGNRLPEAQLQTTLANGERNGALQQDFVATSNQFSNRQGQLAPISGPEQQQQQQSANGRRPLPGVASTRQQQLLRSSQQQQQQATGNGNNMAQVGAAAAAAGQQVNRQQGRQRNQLPANLASAQSNVVEQSVPSQQQDPFRAGVDLQPRFQRLRTPPGGNSGEQFLGGNGQQQQQQNNQLMQFPSLQQQQQQQQQQNSRQQQQFGPPTLSAFDLSSLANLANQAQFGAGVGGNNQNQANNNNLANNGRLRPLAELQQQQVPPGRGQQNNRNLIQALGNQVPNQQQQQNGFSPASSFSSPASVATNNNNNNNGASQTELPFIRQVFRPAGEQQLDSQQPAASDERASARPTPPPLFVPARPSINNNNNKPPRVMESGFSPVVNLQQQQQQQAPQTGSREVFFEPSQAPPNRESNNRGINQQQQQQQQQRNRPQQVVPTTGQPNLINSRPAASNANEQSSIRKPPQQRRPSQRPQLPAIGTGLSAVQTGSSSTQRSVQPLQVATTNNPTTDVIRLAANAIQTANEGLAAALGLDASLTNGPLSTSNAPVSSITTTSEQPPVTEASRPLLTTTNTPSSQQSPTTTTQASTSGSDVTTVANSNGDTLRSRGSTAPQLPLRTSANFFTLTSSATTSPSASSFSPALPINAAVAASGGRRRIPVRAQTGASGSSQAPGSRGASPFMTTTTTMAASSNNQQQVLSTTAASSSTSTGSSVRRPEIEEFYETISGASGSGSAAATTIDGFGAPSRGSSAVASAAVTQPTSTQATAPEVAGGDKSLPTTIASEFYGSRLSNSESPSSPVPTPVTGEESTSGPAQKQQQQQPEQGVRPIAMVNNNNNNNKELQDTATINNNQQQQPVMVPVTYMTTLTYLTTVLHGTHTLETSHESVVKSTELATLNAQLMDQIEHRVPLIQPTQTVSLSSKTKGKGTTIINLKSAVSAYNQELVEALSQASQLPGDQLPKPSSTVQAILQTASPAVAVTTQSPAQQQPQELASSRTNKFRAQSPAGRGTNQQRSQQPKQPLIRASRTVELAELQEAKKSLMTEFVYLYTIKPVDPLVSNQLETTSVRSELVAGATDGPELMSQLMMPSQQQQQQQQQLIDSRGMLRLGGAQSEAQQQALPINLGSTIGKDQSMVTEVNLNIATYIKFDDITNALVEIKPTRLIQQQAAGSSLDSELLLSAQDAAGSQRLTPVAANTNRIVPQLDASFNPIHLSLSEAIEKLAPSSGQQTPALDPSQTSRPKVADAELLRSTSDLSLAVNRQPLSSSASSGVARSQLRSRVASSRFRGAPLNQQQSQQSAQFQFLTPLVGSSGPSASASSQQSVGQKPQDLSSSAVVAPTSAQATPPGVVVSSRAQRPVKSRITRPSLKPSLSSPEPEVIQSSALQSSASPVVSSSSSSSRSSKPRFVVVTRTGQFGIRASAMSSMASAASQSALDAAAASASSAQDSIIKPSTVGGQQAETSTQLSANRMSNRFQKPNRFRGGNQLSSSSSKVEVIPTSVAPSTLVIPTTTTTTAQGSSTSENSETSAVAKTTGEDTSSSSPSPSSELSSSTSPDVGRLPTTTSAESSGATGAAADKEPAATNGDRQVQQAPNAAAGSESGSVVVTYFTTTTHTIPFTINSQTIFTTIEETNSRVATEFMTDLNGRFIEPTPVVGSPAATQQPITTTTQGQVAASSSNAPTTLPPPATTTTTTTTSGQSQQQQEGSSGSQPEVANNAQSQQQQPTTAATGSQLLEPSFVLAVNTRTYFTTYTYFTTFSAGSASPTVQSSESTTSNILTETVTSLFEPSKTPSFGNEDQQIQPTASFNLQSSSAIESISDMSAAGGGIVPTQAIQDNSATLLMSSSQEATPPLESDGLTTRTLLNTMTYYGTLYNGTQTTLTPILDVSTQVLTFSSPGLFLSQSIDAAASSSSAVAAAAASSSINSILSSQVQQNGAETRTVAASGQEVAPEQSTSVANVATQTLDTSDKITRTRSLYTTLTHYITFYSGTKTQLSTIQEISPTVVTEYIDRTLFELQQQQAESSSQLAASLSSAQASESSSSSSMLPQIQMTPSPVLVEAPSSATVISGLEQQAPSSSSPVASDSAPVATTASQQQPSETTTTREWATGSGSSTTPSAEATTMRSQNQESSSEQQQQQPDSVQVSKPSRSPGDSQSQLEGRQESSGGRVLASSEEQSNSQQQQQQQQPNIIELSDLIAGSNHSQSGRVALAGNLGAAIKDIVQLLAGNKTNTQPPTLPGLPQAPEVVTEQQLPVTTSSTTTSTTTTQAASSAPPAGNKLRNGAPTRVYGQKAKEQMLSSLQGSISSPSTVSSTSSESSNQQQQQVVSSSSRATPELAQQASSRLAGNNADAASNQQQQAAATIFFGDDGGDERKKQIKTVWPAAAQSTVYVTSIEPSTRSLTLTTTKVYYTRDAPFTITSSFTTLIAPRTFVSTIMGTRTLVNQLNTQQMQLLQTPTEQQKPAQAVSQSSNKQQQQQVATSSRQESQAATNRLAVDKKQQKQQQIMNEQTQRRQQQQLAASAAAAAAAVANGKQRLATRPIQQQAAGSGAEQSASGGANINQCKPACNVSNNEICRFQPASDTSGAQGTFSCACRPGYYMVINGVGSRQCQEVQSYVVLLRLLQVGDQQVSFKKELQDRSSLDYKQFSRLVKDHVKRAYMTSDLTRDRFVGADVINYARSLGIQPALSSNSAAPQPTAGRQPVAFNTSQMDPLNAGVIVNITVQMQPPTSANELLDEATLKEELTKKLNLRQAAALAAAASAASTANRPEQPVASGGDQTSATSANGANTTMMDEMLPNPNALFLADVEQVTDLDECANPALNDCHESAVCINEVGSYKCDCREYPDLNPLHPGRQCASELKSCDYCNNRGDCIRVPSSLHSAASVSAAGAYSSSSSNNSSFSGNMQRSSAFSTVCQCHRFYLGRRCEINGLMLACLLPIVTILLFISVCLVIYCCRRWRKRSALSKGFRNIGTFGPNMIGGTLDRKAMLESSSESSDTHQRSHHLRAAANGIYDTTGGIPSDPPSSSNESSPRQMVRNQMVDAGGLLQSGSGYHLSPHLVDTRQQANQQQSQQQQQQLNPYCSSIPPQIVIPRARHNQVNYAVHRGQVYMW